MKVSAIMSALVHTVQAKSTLEEAARQLRDENIGCLPVVEEALVQKTHLRRRVVNEIGFTPVVEEEIVVGVLTDRDIVVRAVASGMDPKSTPVSEIMNIDFTCCYVDDDVADAADAMKEKKVRRLMVLDRDEQVLGVVSIDDISSVDPTASGEVLQEITE